MKRVETRVEKLFTQIVVCHLSKEREKQPGENKKKKKKKMLRRRA